MHKAYAFIIMCCVQRDIEISMAPPPGSENKDSAYCYSGMIKITFNKNSKIETIMPSDGSNQWFCGEIRKMIQKRRFKIFKLEQLAKNEKITDCSIIFPVIIASPGYSNVFLKQKATPPDFYKFDKENIKGNVIFGDTI